MDVNTFFSIGVYAEKLNNNNNLYLFLSTNIVKFGKNYCKTVTQLREPCFINRRHNSPLYRCGICLKLLYQIFHL